MNRFQDLINTIQDHAGLTTLRCEAAQKLGVIGDQRAVKPLVAVLDDSDEEVRIAAAEALDAIDKKWRNSSEAKYQVSELIACVIDNDEESSTRLIATRALAILSDPRAVSALIATLGDENEMIRSATIEALGTIKDLRAIAPLIDVVCDENQVIRDIIIEALDDIDEGWRGSPEAKNKVSELISYIIDTDEESSARCVAISVIIALGDSRAVDSLTLIQNDKDENVQRSAIEALFALGALDVLKNPYAVEPLIDILNNGEQHFRKAAAKALGTIKDPRAVGPLVAALDDGDRHFRGAAAEALGAIKDPRAVEPLIAALNDENEDVLIIVTEALGTIKDPRAVGPLVAVLGDEDEAVRGAVVEALGKIGNSRAVESLIVALRDESKYVRRVAAEVLSAIKDPRAVEPLIVALGDEDESVQEAARESLRHMKLSHTTWR